jgi:hypothetical protein
MADQSPGSWPVTPIALLAYVCTSAGSFAGGGGRFVDPPPAVIKTTTTMITAGTSAPRAKRARADTGVRVGIGVSV